MKAAAIIAAGGSGTRFGRETPKQFVPIAGVPLLFHTLRAFEKASGVGEVVAVLPAAEVHRLNLPALKRAGFRKVAKVVPGGATRQESVHRGLEAVDSAPELVAIHDAARCLIEPGLIDAALEACSDHWQGAIVALPVRDTLKRVWGMKIHSTESRETLWGMQTPQVFRYPFIRDAYRRAVKEGFHATDDAAVAERAGAELRVVEGSLRNMKVTAPEDVDLAERLLQPARGGGTDVRIGEGMDIHPFSDARPLVLGGVEIPGARGLAGHSDADALIHAVCDALLGALSLGDIGRRFPDTDPAYEGRSSAYFLEKVRDLVQEQGWRIANIDSTLLTEEPLLKNHFEPMRQRLAELLRIEIAQVSVKATRPEKLGAFGRKEGLMAFASALLTR